MTETNSLFEEIKCKLSRMIGNYGIIKKEVFHDEIFKDIQAYGKAEFDRGHTEGNRAYKCGCIEIINENIELKEQNKELIDIMMYDVSDEDLARKVQGPEWHEYKKRLPLPNKAIIVKWRYADE